MRYLTPASISLLYVLEGCATYWQASDLEEKVDQLLKNTQRATMQDIFGEQTQAISERMESMSTEERAKIDELLSEYQKGSQSIDEVRASVIGAMGGPDRVVSSSRGIWVRDTDGKRLTAIGRNAKLKGCAQLSPEELPPSVRDSRALAEFSWGKGELNGRPVIFPWELTMSAFTKEIVENTARRTAQEVIRMAGDKGWSRPVHIQVITDPKQTLTINHPGAESEVFVTTDAEQGGAPSPSKPEKAAPQNPQDPDKKP